MVGYVLGNTLSEYGTVARGICHHDGRMYLANVTERTGIRQYGEGAVFVDEHGLEQQLMGNEIVSMNLWGFAPDIFEHLRKQFNTYLHCHGGENQSEFYIPTVVNALVQGGQKRVRILKTNDNWFGMTHRNDKAYAQTCVQRLIHQGVYPDRLW